MNRTARQAVAAEFEGASLGHAGRTTRAKKIVSRLAHRPGGSIPDAMETSADIEGFYKFVRSDKFRTDGLFEAHQEQTRRRCRMRGLALLLHDTTDFSFGGYRAGLGPITDGGHGFFGHVCFAVDRNGIPLGVAGLLTYARSGKAKPKKKSKGAKQPDRESLRWAELALDVGAQAKGRFEAIHIADSEADDYELLAALVSANERFIIRTAQNRNVSEEQGGKLRTALEKGTLRLRRQVALSERRSKPTKSRSRRNQPRKARQADLEIFTRTITVRRPTICTSDVPDELTLNFVHVREVNVPAGQEAVDWVLVTTEPVETKKQVAFVVDCYRHRWVIEEFFKAIKTGCGFEQAQLESLDALLRYLALLLPVAWLILALKSLQRDRPDASAKSFLSPLQLKVLRGFSEAPLPASLTILEATLAIARLGGHIKANGLPGWIILGRGMRRIQDGVLLLEGLKKAGKRDQ